MIETNSTPLAPNARLRRCSIAVGLMLACLCPPDARAQDSRTEPVRPEPLDAHASGTIPATFDATRAVLLDLAAFGDWFPSLSEWKVIETADAHTRIYGRHGLPWPAEDRDYIVDYRWWDEPDGAFVLEARARADASTLREGIVRLDALRSRWTLERRGPDTAVRYEVELIPRGDLPRWIEDASWQRESWRLLDALEQEVARRRSRAPRQPDEPAAR